MRFLITGGAGQLAQLVCALWEIRRSVNPVVRESQEVFFAQDEIQNGLA